MLVKLFKACSNLKHSRTSVGSPYPIHKVPLELFLKDLNNRDKGYYLTCLHCRNQAEKSNITKKDKKTQEKEEKLRLEKEQKRIVEEQEIEKEREKLKREIEQHENLIQEILADFKHCSDRCHEFPSVGSPYPENKVPRNMFFKDPNNPTGREFKYCFHCRASKQKSAKNVKDIKEKIIAETPKDPNYGICSNKDHRSFYQYPWDKIPIISFMEDPNDPSGRIFKTCSECREAASLKSNEFKEQIAREREKMEKDNNFRICSHRDHGTRSDYPRNETPKEMFRKIKEDPKSELFEQCSDCREIHSIQSNKIRNKMREGLEEDEFFCEGCKKPQPLTMRGKNFNGTESSCCFHCKEKSMENGEKIQRIRLRFKEDTIKKNCCSCEMCKNIYLIPEEGTHYTVELSTYEKDGTRYVDYKGETFEAQTFVHNYEHLLELRVLHFDHLSEEEQRERGILKDGEIYIGKKGNVSGQGSVSSINREAEKTQLICIRCHVKETMRRCKNKGENTKTGYAKKKMDYVNKMREKGCSVCNFYDPKLPKFLDFDHIDPKNKKMNVSKMVVEPDCTMEDLINECDESVTRVICKHCHAIHTAEQQGWIYNLYQ